MLAEKFERKCLKLFLPRERNIAIFFKIVLSTVKQKGQVVVSKIQKEQFLNSVNPEKEETST